MSNESLRDRFGIAASNAAMISRLLKDTLTEGLIKKEAPTSKSRKHIKYIPFWA